MSAEFRGIGVALITPFGRDGQMDEAALSKLIEHNIKGGVDYLVVLGTTAETATLTEAEKKKMKQLVIDQTRGRVPLVLGVGGNNTVALQETLRQPETQKFQAVLSVSPYYNKPSQNGIVAHFEALAAASPLPLILYNVPSRTGSNMTAATTLTLAHKSSKFIGIKEASGDLVQAMHILRQRPEGFLVISGDDITAFPLIGCGGDGVISVIGQALPSVFSTLIRAALNAENDKAKKIQYELIPLMEAIFKEGNPTGIKALLNHLGLSQTTVRLPLVEASEALQNEISQLAATVQQQKLVRV